MKIFTTVEDMRAYVKACAKKELTVGFVPTMGAFHKGHISLMQAARKENDIVTVSIFVNPIQFCSGEDYDRYPRQTDLDRRIAEAEGVDALFHPTVAEIYPKGFDSHVDQVELPAKLCGPFRQGHFRGVMTVVCKLMNVVEPHSVYFGQKDYQQYLIIRRMVHDLNFDVKVRMLPIVREEDGLAMSSRNVYLGPKQRREATCIHRSLQRAKDMIAKGENDAGKVAQEMRREIRKTKGARIDYIAVTNAETLENIREIKGKVLIAVAVRIGKTRLIDNVLLG
jgi:pantoate--beta-alanine ligase